jgi:predicted secreted Zn-dependent protease
VIESTQDHAWKPVNAGKREPFEVRHAKQMEWARKHLPNENPAMVVAVIGNLKLTRNMPDTSGELAEVVMARLKATGRAA